MKLNKTMVAVLATLTLLSTACSKTESSPTATARAFYEAIKSGNAQGMKNSLSKGSLAWMETVARSRNKSLDESLAALPPPPSSVIFEARNEIINGDTATLEIKGAGGKWQIFPFVKEDGQWKIAFDQLWRAESSGGQQ